jgi:hypothetical protein
LTGFYAEILMPDGTIEEFARLPTFDEAIAWLDTHRASVGGGKGRLFGVVTDEQIRILREKGYATG